MFGEIPIMNMNIYSCYEKRPSWVWNAGWLNNGNAYFTGRICAIGSQIAYKPLTSELRVRLARRETGSIKPSSKIF